MKSLEKNVPSSSWQNQFLLAESVGQRVAVRVVMQQLNDRVAMAPSAELLIERGVLYCLERNYVQALRDFDEAEGLDPERIEVDIFRGRTLIEYGSYGLAARVLRRFLTRRSTQDTTYYDPWVAVAHLLLGRALLSQGRGRAAAAQFELALVQYRHPRTCLFLDRARSYRQAGDIDAAIEGLDHAIERLGSIPAIESYAIELELERNDLAGALARIDRQIEISPIPELWLLRRGEVLEEAGCAEAALVTFQQALTHLLAQPIAKREMPALKRLERRLRAALDHLNHEACSGAYTEH